MLPDSLRFVVRERRRLRAQQVTTPTDAPVEERHRRAAASSMEWSGPYAKKWIAGEPTSAARQFLANAIARNFANAERDGRASRDAEVSELSAYRRAMLKFIEWANAETEREWQGEGERGIIRSWKKVRTYLAEELARKGTP